MARAKRVQQGKFNYAESNELAETDSFALYLFAPYPS